MKGSIQFLGTGASMGVPMLGCKCKVCQSELPANKRLRSSVAIHVQNKRFIIDTGPDFRQQILSHHIPWIDGVLLTHSHYDHISGLDDLRPLYFKRANPLPILLSAHTAKEVREQFFYLFKDNPYQLNENQKLDFIVFEEESGKTVFEGVEIEYFTYEQSLMKVNGFRIGKMAYVSDIKNYTPCIFSALKELDLIVISALRQAPSPMHLSVEEAVDFINKTKAKQGIITHISHDLDHEETNASLPTHIRLGYDGLTTEFGLDYE